MPRAPEDVLTTLLPRGCLWHRPRGRKKWLLLGTYPSVPDAVGVLLAEQPITGGDFYALREGAHPTDPDEDD